MNSATTNGQRQPDADDWPQSEYWSYSQADGWQRLDDDPAAEYVDDDGDTNWYQAGYTIVGESHHAQLYEAEDDTPLSRQYQFIVEFSAGGYLVHLVFIRDIPSLLALSPLLAVWWQKERVEGTA